MSNAELSDHQLLDKAKAALRDKDGDGLRFFLPNFQTAA